MVYDRVEGHKSWCMTKLNTRIYRDIWRYIETYLDTYDTVHPRRRRSHPRYYTSPTRHNTHQSYYSVYSHQDKLKIQHNVCELNITICTTFRVSIVMKNLEIDT